ncbi:hypothetical protein FB45DRAFT_833475 [Roridomyces roridus]|uniref:GYF domain-containing protein n=1 Tax=Roridomyces roridus TaxID=1738132 RepID=A0AAD7FLH7_9AGAR|nr:hypothetical protein FB45DRAFT_833475 [Roridomyces roridus]
MSTDDDWHDASVELDVYEAPLGIDIQEVQVDVPAPSGLDKIVTQEEDGTSPHDSSRGPSLSTTEQLSDANSVHSMPAVLVTEPHSPTRATPPQTPPPVSPSRQSTTAPSALERRNRHRSAAEVRAPNRLSGFFTNLIHRREASPAASSRPIREETRPPPSPLGPRGGQTSSVQSRSTSPVPARPVTPPPRLPPPTLNELGLSLSVLTADLSPSHFSTPPTSGAFLAPHYLLLCHAQGLDVLPLTSPPLSQPYALVRRVSFKTVVVMEQRGVLVAIAGRRDGVRVYALEEIKKAVEWRMDVEIRRERERQRRDAVKKIGLSYLESDPRDSSEKVRKASLSTPPEAVTREKLPRKGSNGSLPAAPPSPIPPTPLIPRTPTIKRFKAPRTTPPPPVPEPLGRPPPYSRQPNEPEPFLTTRQSRSRSGSVSNVLAAAPMSRRPTVTTRPHDPDSKADWVESSDDEAINVVAAGASGSQALDERTSVRLSANLSAPPATNQPVPVGPLSPTTSRRTRPANLDLTLSMPSSSSQIAPPEPSPTPTLLTLRQALSNSPSGGSNRPLDHDPDTPFFGDLDEEDDENDGGISLAEALMESRLPNLPPAGTRQPQEPILLGGRDEPASPWASEHSAPTEMSHTSTEPRSRRRRWSVIIGQALAPSSVESAPPPARNTPPMARSQSFRSSASAASTVQPVRPSTASTPPSQLISTSPPNVLPDGSSQLSSHVSASSSRSSRFIPRIISNAFTARRDDRPPLPALKTTENDVKRTGTTPTTSHLPPPKLEYVKLPGTKGALTIKSVETAKKSFLAILCGENGEKVELFAGTYRTALGLSRTFILPDSPRLLELQLQGDDLVEVFLVFGQNVFGLEPATVRVREVRIGRAERRAARRRAREVREGLPEGENPPGEEDTNVNVSIGVSVSVGETVVASGPGPEAGPATPLLVANEHPDNGDQGSEPNGEAAAEPTTSISHAEELVALATARMGPYTTFQQLSFAPKFPLASIADEYIIPPTYPDFLDYRTEHEPETSGSHSTDLTQIQFSPPGLPVPTATAPSKWFYRDPKNNVHGPWKASLMQAWYKDGLLPPDLPVRREEDAEYMLLKDLRLQSIDPAHPFRNPPPPSTPSAAEFGTPEKPLLSPISLLAQPRHFGPPALFFSTRGGHSTAIVDARGRSVLKGRFVWSDDDAEDSKPARMGDVKRLEAFDVRDRSVLVAMRQGGLEVVDLSDALLKPADESRTVLPQFAPAPSNISRRGPFVWKMGTPVSASATSSTILTSKTKSSTFTAHIPGKKPSSASAKSPAARTEFATGGDNDVEMTDEVLFLGRKEDEIYICERNAGSFRILRLGPNS